MLEGTECVQKVGIKVVAKEKKWLPAYQSHGAAGADIFAAISDELIIEPGKVALIPTGLFFEIPQGYEVQIRPRSGLALRHQVTVLNAPGTIDSDYRGEVSVLLINHGAASFSVFPGMRIAQIVIASVVQGEIILSDTLSDTQRGAGGFGHTGYFPKQ